MLESMADSDGATERTAVKTYVPAYQREEWDEHAERLDMSRSEFLRTMVQAGRRGFEGTGHRSESDETGGSEESASPDVPTDMEATVLAELSEERHHSWDELLAAVTADVEQRLEETLQRLQAAGEIQHSPRQGGYRLQE